jgi:hypothetical protein
VVVGVGRLRWRRNNSRADIDENLAENEVDQNQSVPSRVDVVVRPICTESVAKGEDKSADRMQAEQFPSLVPAGQRVD